MDVDASYNQLGCVLLQEQTGRGFLLIGYFSRGFWPVEKNCVVTELEGLGVVWAVTSLRHYLEREKFLVPRDHSAFRLYQHPHQPVAGASV